ncbi:uncharacterized protein PGTG_03187 [Puccinia graminis f. sp. tritici CRL 75-36-700-3]|uniref:Uncharacterized protein n=1 Tax=Puccinia graminis f. sp. tritici (strain CRL 75-36-700-3 / race SCCL) TaxID=418459 RepID=E3JYV6_PUCGT|nr:uncharacterized protein PGTG_03187 [Puccinia graminis f. sp. tritici CRL 75-36-700-3]EFP77231.2 hypothetical protein PGTG_03187 [Puccinia graminis f. sp. tritici CRL 75-36-700-3]
MKNSFIFTIAFIQSSSSQGFTHVLHDATPALQDLESGQQHASFDKNLIEPPSRHIHIPDYTSTLPSDLLQSPTGSLNYYLDLFHSITDDHLLQFGAHPFHPESSAALPTASSSSESIHSNHPQPNHIPTPSASLDELRVEDYATPGLVHSNIDELFEWATPYRGSLGSLPIDTHASAIEPPTLKNQHSTQIGTSLSGDDQPASPKLNEDPKNDRLNPKRKALEDPPVANLKKKARKIRGDNKTSGSKTRTKSNAKTAKPVPKRLKQNLLKEHLEVDGNQVAPFDGRTLDLERSAWLSTLVFPGVRMWKNGLLDKGVLHNSDLWKRLNSNHRFSAYPILIQELVNSRKIPQETVLSNAMVLLEEIFYRDGQFLIPFTLPDIPKTKSKGHPEQYGAKSEEIIGLRSKEQEGLLEWLVKLFNIGMESDDKFLLKSDGSPYPISSIQKKIFEYLSKDPESEEQNSKRWITMPRGSKIVEQRAVSYEDAMKTQVAINTLGDYYKFTNFPKWRKLFSMDDHFFNVFEFIKLKEHNSMVSKLRKDELVEWTKLKVFPWNDPLISTEEDFNPEDLLPNFISRIQERWTGADKHLDVYVKQPVPRQLREYATEIDSPVNQMFGYS